jgi:hypothetical protein
MMGSDAGRRPCHMDARGSQAAVASDPALCPLTGETPDMGGADAWRVCAGRLAPCMLGALDAGRFVGE